MYENTLNGFKLKLPSLKFKLPKFKGPKIRLGGKKKPEEQPAEEVKQEDVKQEDSSQLSLTVAKNVTPIDKVVSRVVDSTLTYAILGVGFMAAIAAAVIYLKKQNVRKK